VREGAAGMMLVHNHPSGDPTPSPADRSLTTRLSQAGQLVGVPLVDHLIVAQGGHHSFASARSFSGHGGSHG
jgi:DNA repair protein RadC